jgi:hypothetical protein
MKFRFEENIEEPRKLIIVFGKASRITQWFSYGHKRRRKDMKKAI